jgi:hypothetical protein
LKFREFMVPGDAGSFVCRQGSWESYSSAKQHWLAGYFVPALLR